MQANRKDLTLKAPPERILVISMRYLGDLLLSTVLFKTLRFNYPNATLHALVYENSAAILEGNRDIDKVITTPIKPNKKEFKVLCKTLHRKYDLAIATETGDRRYLYAILAAPKRVAFTPPKYCKGWWKRYLVQGWLEYDEFNTHTVIALVQLAQLLGLTPQYQLTPPRSLSKEDSLQLVSLPEKYIVLHPHPQWRYKRWPIAAWQATLQFLISAGFALVFTGGPGKQEQEYANEILTRHSSSVINLIGQTSLGQLTAIIENALLFIGPDTGTTHLAAATGIPVIAIYGPTTPVKWGPWPIHFRQNHNPFKKTGDQQVQNIHLLQGRADCVPCQQEGCEGHRDSYSACLDNLPAETVIQECRKILGLS